MILRPPSWAILYGLLFLPFVQLNYCINEKQITMFLNENHLQILRLVKLNFHTKSCVFGKILTMVVIVGAVDHFTSQLRLLVGCSKLAKMFSNLQIISLTRELVSKI
jgi:hypothetical protein